jgi:hypothetical protein
VCCAAVLPQALRERLIPSAKAYPLDALLEDCAEYFQATKRRVSFEYTLMAGVNDAPEHVSAGGGGGVVEAQKGGVCMCMGRWGMLEAQMGK